MAIASVTVAIWVAGRPFPAKTFAVNIKSRPGRGAFIEDISGNNLEAASNVGGFLRLNILNSGLMGEDPIPGDEGVPTIKKFSFTNIKVDHVPILVDGTSIHPPQAARRPHPRKHQRHLRQRHLPREHEERRNQRCHRH